MTHRDPPTRPPLLRVEPRPGHVGVPKGGERPMFGFGSAGRAPERARFSAAAANEPPDEPA